MLVLWLTDDPASGRRLVLDHHHRLLCGINMLMTGIVGLYVGRIHAEVKRRPFYVVSTKEGFDRDQAAPARSAIHAVHE